MLPSAKEFVPCDAKAATLEALQLIVSDEALPSFLELQCRQLVGISEVSNLPLIEADRVGDLRKAEEADGLLRLQDVASFSVLTFCEVEVLTLRARSFAFD